MKATLMLVGLLVIGGIPASASAEEVPSCSVGVEISNGTQVVGITGHQPGAKTIYANLSIQVNTSNNTTVSLTTSVSSGWPTSISPANFKANENGSRSVSITVIVPPGELSNQTGDLSLTVRAITEGYESWCAYFTVKGPTLAPSPYLEIIDVVLAQPYLEVERTAAGADTQLNFTCAANAPVRLELRYLSDGLVVTGPETLDIPWEQHVRGAVMVPMHVGTANARPGVHTFRVNATATVEGGRTISTESVIFVRVGAAEEAFAGLLVLSAVSGAAGVIGTAFYLRWARSRV